MVLYYGAHIRQQKSPERPLRVDELLHCIHVQEESSTPSAYMSCLGDRISFRPALLSFMVRFQKWYRGAQHQPNLDLAGLKDECRKRRCKENAARFNTEEEVRFCICGDNIHVQFCVARTAAEFSQKKLLRRRFGSQLKRDRENE
ncbi:hypothetical protein RB195_023627 [Necator americanus]|uniref:Uncharacterized protein n=1 Tax=Necator americanus TaxID=51031 RepID=A0ABR1EKV2_NECAM